LDGYVVAEENTSLDKGVSLRNCILLPGSKIEMKMRNDIGNPPVPPLIKGGKGGLFIENCIIGPGFKIDLNEIELFNVDEGTHAILIGTGGSDRKYYRIKENGNSAVLMHCSENDTEFQRHLEYSYFFKKHSIPVPELFNIEPEKKRAKFEDLGDISLYSYLKCPREFEEIEEIYKSIIDILILLHTKVTEYVSECPLLIERVFDYEHLRWETNYFIERFVVGIRDIKIKNLSALNKEFHNLAIKVDSFPKTIIHRDFQSQNIMITKGKIPRVLDYQGARIGPPAYDVVSLLWDPYYRLDDDIRERLLNYYIKHVTNIPQSPFTKGGLRGITEKGFRDTLLPCRLQRHMQALGAFGFLSKVKGKKYFLKHIPEGLRLLKEDVSLVRDEYPELYKLVMNL
jgi:aminoglycoside/choline kinase family phosphotransferase